MPKKKTKTQKEDSEKDKILDELASQLKESLNKEKKEIDKEESEKSGLEEDVNLDTLDFNQFIQPMHSEDAGAPVLERIAGSQPGPIFVGGISQAQTIPGEGKKSDDFKYVPGQEENNEPKYIESSERISREPERIDLARAGRETTGIIPQTNQEAFFRSSEPGLQTESNERQWRAEQIDIERAGRENPFRKEETRSEKYKPKPPKSY